jgi:hypothetical protein
MKENRAFHDLVQIPPELETPKCLSPKVSMFCNSITDNEPYFPRMHGFRDTASVDFARKYLFNGQEDNLESHS